MMMVGVFVVVVVVQKPSVTRYTYQIRSVQTCLLHVTEHLIEMIQYFSSKYDYSYPV